MVGCHAIITHWSSCEWLSRHDHFLVLFRPVPRRDHSAHTPPPTPPHPLPQSVPMWYLIWDLMQPLVLNSLPQYSHLYGVSSLCIGVCSFSSLCVRKLFLQICKDEPPKSSKLVLHVRDSGQESPLWHFMGLTNNPLTAEKHQGTDLTHKRFQVLMDQFVSLQIVVGIEHLVADFTVVPSYFLSCCSGQSTQPCYKHALHHTVLCCVLHCMVQYCPVLCCAVVYCTKLHSTALHITALYWITLYYTARIALHNSAAPYWITCTRYWITLYWITLYCTALHRIALHSAVLHHTELHCTALYWITLYRTVLNCTVL